MIVAHLHLARGAPGRRITPLLFGHFSIICVFSSTLGGLSTFKYGLCTSISILIWGGLTRRFCIISTCVWLLAVILLCITVQVNSGGSFDLTAHLPVKSVPTIVTALEKGSAFDIAQQFLLGRAVRVRILKILRTVGVTPASHKPTCTPILATLMFRLQFAIPWQVLGYLAAEMILLMVRRIRELKVVVFLLADAGWVLLLAMMIMMMTMIVDQIVDMVLFRGLSLLVKHTMPTHSHCGS